MSSRVVAGALVALLVAGCSADAEPPTSLPPLTASPAVTTSAPLPTPSGINAPDAFGASAFVRHFFDQVNRAYRGRDPALIQTLSTADCQTCNNFAAEIKRLVAEGHTFDGGDFNLLFAESAPPEGDVAVVDAAYTTSPTAERASDGRVVKRYPARPRTAAQIRIDYRNGQWFVRAVREVKV